MVKNCYELWNHKHMKQKETKNSFLKIWETNRNKLFF